MKKSGLAVMAVMVMTTTGVWAGDAPDKTAKKGNKAEKELAVQEMTITGTVTKMETKKKDGTPMMTWFRLVDEAGSEVRVPKGKIEEFVGCKVKVTGEGYTLEKKTKSMRAFKTITAIEKLQDAVVPAVPAQ
jgi:hypothetical protein